MHGCAISACPPATEADPSPPRRQAVALCCNHRAGAAIGKTFPAAVAIATLYDPGLQGRAGECMAIDLTYRARTDPGSTIDLASQAGRDRRRQTSSAVSAGMGDVRRSGIADGWRGSNAGVGGGGAERWSEFKLNHTRRSREPASHRALGLLRAVSVYVISHGTGSVTLLPLCRHPGAS